eukprot:1204792-Pyramimonas_sp.AAC.1
MIKTATLNLAFGVAVGLGQMRHRLRAGGQWTKRCGVVQLSQRSLLGVTIIVYLGIGCPVPDTLAAWMPVSTLSKSDALVAVLEASDQIT